MSKYEDEDFWESASRRQALESNRRREAKMFANGWRRNILFVVLLALTLVCFLTLS
ncbi:hypothetical protein [Variovorax sp. JS1663]|uniref:hypothetical protein n=1 Tax=Variovorax sp. JS1663 TaxID=1851577 RepID=UPI001302409F|nr:hypothetical protein [Variovorax sp. JS1663]